MSDLHQDRAKLMQVLVNEDERKSWAVAARRAELPVACWIRTVLNREVRESNEAGDRS